MFGANQHLEMMRLGLCWAAFIENERAGSVPKDWSKSERKELRRLATLGYERELSKALGELERAFQEWRRGEIDAIELNDTIHGYHQGPSRDIWARYVCPKPAMAVARALATNVLKPEDVSEGVWSGLEGFVEIFRDDAQ